MSRLMSAVWVVELLLLLSATVLMMGWPESLFTLFEQCETVERPCQCEALPKFAAKSACSVPRGLCTDPDICSEPDIDKGDHRACRLDPCPNCKHILERGKKACIIVRHDAQAQGLFAFARMLAPFLLAFALLAGHAAMREDEGLRSNISFVFAWVYVVLAMLVATDDFNGSILERSHLLPRVLFAVLLTLVLFALFAAWRAEDRILRVLALFFAAAYAALAAADALTVHGRTVAWITLALYVLDTMIAGFERIRSRLYALAIVFPAVFVATDTWSASIFGTRAGDPGVGPSLVTHILHERKPLTLVFVAVVVLLAVLHAVYAAWPTSEAARRLSGAANTRPSSLWVLWFVQGLAYLTGAVVLMLLHEDHSNLVIRNVDHDGYRELFNEVKQLFPAFLVAMGLLSFTGLSASREWVWRGLSTIFALFYGAAFLDMLLVSDRTLFHAWVPILIAPTVVLFLVHVRYASNYHIWFSEEVGEGPDGWLLMDLVLGPLLFAKTLFSGRRASHGYGVAASGRIVVLPRGEITTDCGCARPPGGFRQSYPLHELFEPKKKYRCVVRFGNERDRDDAAADARGAALRILDPHSERPVLDLLLGTGAYAPAPHVVGLGKVAFANALGRFGRRWLAQDRMALEGGIAALRRAPESYARLVYHTQTVKFWVAEDNERYLVRYRLVPCHYDLMNDGEPTRDATLILDPEEPGLPITRDDFIDRARRPDDLRPRDYLRSELKMRLEAKHETARFRLQGQFHKIASGYSDEWYNPATDWKHQDHPWIDLAEITLFQVLSEAETEKLAFNPSHAPQSLGTPVATGFYDYRSIADSERRVMRRVQELRQWMTQTFGPPRRASSPLE